MKLHKKSFVYALVMTISAAGVTAMAQQKRPAQKKAVARPAARAAAPQQPPVRTVGDMLKQAKGAGQLQMQKGSMAIPQGSAPLFSQQPKQSQVNLSTVKPPSTRAFYQDASDDKAKLEAITDRQINELYKLTQKFRQSQQRGELWLRLAELYAEKAGVIEFRKQEAYDKQLAAFQSGQTKVKPSINLKDAREYNLKAIQLYEWFIRDFPKDPKKDQALFFLGYNYYELGNNSKGTEYYTQLTKEHPRSPYLLEVSFQLGEYWFEKEKWGQAREYYERVAQNRRHRLYSFSMYKAAWCYFRGGDPRKALGTMERLIRESKEEAMVAEAGGKRISKSKLESEGLRDMVLFYSEVGDAQKAPGYFQSLAGRDSYGFIEKLAYLYADKGNRDGARFLFNHLIERAPTSPKAFDYKYQIVQTFTTANRSREFREELYSWVKDFGNSSAWFQANQNNKELVDNSVKLREQTLRTWVLQQHQTAQNSRTQFAQGLAFEGYRLYLTEFPATAMAADMHFYFGELLYDMNRFDDAGAQYRWVVEKAPTSKFFAKAGENMVLALEKNVPKDEELAKKAGQSVEPMAMDPKVEKFAAAGNWYANKFPSSEKTPEIKFRVGRLFYQHNQFDKAIPAFKDVIQKYPKTKYAEYSANLLLDIYNLKKDYEGLEKTGRELLAVPALASSPVGTEIRSVLEKTTFTKAKGFEDSKNFAKSAESFEAFAKQNPRSELATTALFNAAINYEKAGMNSKAMAAHIAMIRSTDKGADKFKPKSRRIVAKLYQDAGQLEEAAVAFEQTAVEAGNDPLAPNLFFNAAVLNEALGREQSAIKNYQAYISKVRKASDRADANYSIATIHRKAGRSSVAINHYKEYINLGGISNEKNVESAYWIYELSRQVRRKSESEEWRRKTLGMQARYSPEKKGVGATYAAKIKILDAQETYAEFRGISMNNLKRLKEQADKKISLLTKINSQLADVIKYDSPEEIVASLYLLGQANLHMGESFTGAPVPPELKAAEEIAQYKAGVQKLADPFFAKAKESLKAAVDRGNDFETYSVEYRKARETLNKWDAKVLHDGGEIASEYRTSGGAGI